MSATTAAVAEGTRISQVNLSELTLPTLTLSAVVCLSRLFTQPWRFFVPVALVAVTVHAVAWACRRQGIGLALAAVISGVAAFACTTWSVLGSSTRYGVPWTETAHAARLALDKATTVYRSSAAPVEVIAGFTIAGAVGAATCAFLADWAGFRMRATTEACLPSFSLFVLSATLAQGHGVVAAGAVWLAALLAFLLTRQPAVESPATAWFASRSRRGPRAILASGAVLAAAATGATVIVGPRLPGATIHPIWNWRNRATGGNRTIGTSPLVDITARLKSLSHQEVFVVSAPRPDYWRPTSLDTFTGTGWALDNEYVGTGSKLAPAARTADIGPSDALYAQVHIGKLGSIWLPAAYRPVRLTGAKNVSFSSESGSVITNGSTTDGMDYLAESAVPAATPAQLRAAPPIDPADPAMTRYLRLPAGVSDMVRPIAEEVTRGVAGPYAQALALQDWLRAPPFRYDLTVKPDGSQDALVNFLTVTKAGFCQQYAAAYAVLARSIGLPARVAVGFTEGTLSPVDGLYHVTEAEAHAWPEVYFTGVGWIAFEPTPTRGSPDPFSVAVTGVPPAQPVQAPTTTAAPAPAPAATTPAAAPTVTHPKPTTPPKPITPLRHVHHGHTLLWLFVILALPVAWIGIVAAGNAAAAARRRSAASTPHGMVDLAWSDVRAALSASGAPPLRSETPAEFAGRAGRVATLPSTARTALVDIAHAVEIADYSADGPTPEVARSAVASAATVERALRETFTWWDKARRLLDPRPWWSG